MRSSKYATAGAGELYRNVKLELEQLSTTGTQKDWNDFATSVLEALMRCQAIAIDNQRTIDEANRLQLASPAATRLTEETAEALWYADQLRRIYETAKRKLGGR